MKNQTVIMRVLDKLSRGWCSCNLDDGTPIRLVYSTRLKELLSDRYQVLEGPYRDKVIKIKDITVVGTMDFKIGQQPCIYESRKGELVLPGLGAFATIPQSLRLAHGNYRLGLPSHPSLRLTKSEYLDESFGGSRLASTWFQLLNAGGMPTHSFLHIGRISDGCITIRFQEHGKDWASIFLYLLAHRTPSGDLLEIEVR